MIELERLQAKGLHEDAARRAIEVGQQSGEPIGVVLNRLGLLPDGAVADALGQAYRVPVVKPTDLPASPLDTPIEVGFLRHHRLLPLSSNGDTLSVAMVDPGDIERVNALAFATGLTVEVSAIGFQSWSDQFERLYGDGISDDAAASTWSSELGALEDLNLDAPAVKRIETLVRDAYRQTASDIHLERTPEGAAFRFRIDGYLIDKGTCSPAMADALIARLKVLAKLDVSDHRRAQDGRFTFSVDGHPIDLRLSVIPGGHGEAAVVRLLSRSHLNLDLPALGFSNEEQVAIQQAVNSTQGLYLVAGPTGSGKTTTLYAAINLLRGQGQKIVTIEDPIEYHFEDVHQTQLDEKVGLSFANALRAFLRHDPDVIMVGEIRDADTARTAVQAALTGHLVLATIHANSAAEAPIRLREMGVDPYLIEATLNATTAQRLVRRLCPQCRTEETTPTSPQTRSALGETTETTLWSPVGCAQCHDGYRGRLVISETLAKSDGAGEHASLKQDGIEKAKAGLTSLDEVLRAVSNHA